MKKYCLLLYPPSAGLFLPRGLLEIASFLKSKGVSIAIAPLAYYLNLEPPGIDNKNALHSILEKLIKESKPSVIGISNQFTKDFPLCLEILSICKKINKKITTVIGGPHVTFLDKECLESPPIDIIVRGEGEWTMLELLSALKKGRDLTSVRGISFRCGTGIFRTADRPLGNLDELPPLNFGLLPQKFIRKAMVVGMLNRGCSYNCKFCGEKTFWKMRRSFPVKRLINEMKILENKYANKMLGIDDSMVSIGSGQFFQVCSGLIREKIDLVPNFYMLSRVDTINKEGIGLLNKAGISTVYVGIESASLKVLRMMNKFITPRQIFNTCEMLRAGKIRTTGSWMIGHPGDNPIEAERSLTFLKKLLARNMLNIVDLAIFLPVPGTDFFHQPEKYGIQILSYDWSKWLQFTDTPICQLKDFSAQQISGFHKKIMSTLKAYGLLRNYTGAH